MLYNAVELTRNYITIYILYFHDYYGNLYWFTKTNETFMQSMPKLTEKYKKNERQIEIS